MNARTHLATSLVALLAVACGKPSSAPAPDAYTGVGAIADAQGHTAATAFTETVNTESVRGLPLDDAQDFADAARGLVASEPAIEIEGAEGNRIWSTKDYAFVKGDAPNSVNPSLWRQAKLNGAHGLFKVVDGIYQLRGYDISNMTIIESDNGWIVVDPL